MQTRIRRHSFSYFVLLMKLSSLLVEWCLHIDCSTLPAVPPQVLTWDVLYLALGQCQFLKYYRESKVNIQQKLLGQMIRACAYNADKHQICSCTIHTHYMCVHIFSASFGSRTKACRFFLRFLRSGTFSDCLKGSQAVTLSLLLFNNKPHNCLPLCLCKLIVF